MTDFTTNFGNGQTADEASGGRPASRERSTIQFPYSDLTDAFAVARVIHDDFGGNASQDQIAAGLGTKVTSSGFRMKMAAAKLFGLVEGRGDASLTTLGKEILDPRTESQARAKAFLRIPLYEQIYDRHRGSTLPGDRGIESEMRELGVSDKQLGKARQVFTRSAEQAGFFKQGKDRLVAPRSTQVEADEPKKHDDKARRQPSFDSGEYDPLIVGLFRRIPASGEWSSAEQEKWLTLAGQIFPMVYGSDGEVDDT